MRDILAMGFISKTRRIWRYEEEGEDDQKQEQQKRPGARENIFLPFLKRTTILREKKERSTVKKSRKDANVLRGTCDVEDIEYLRGLLFITI